MVGIGPDAFADTVRATALAVTMQRLSALPIDTVVTSVDEALAGRLPAIVIAADGWRHPDVRLPISIENGSLTLDGIEGSGESTTLTLDPDLKYGALQAFFDGHRSLLVATSNGAPAQLDELLRWMSADPKRFSALDGAAVVAAPGQQPVVVGPQPGVAAAPAASSTGAWIRWAGGAVLMAAAAGAALLIRRRRTVSGQVRVD
jgi:hypothetical protein